MRQVLITALCALLLTSGAVQSAKNASGGAPTASRQVSPKIVTDPMRGTAETVTGRFATNKSDRREIRAVDFVASRTDLFGLRDPRTELRLVREETDQLGMAHLRFDQMHEGLRVWGCQKIVHFGADEDIYMVAGQTIASPDISIAPTVTSPAAEVTAYQAAQSEIGDFAVRPESELLVYPDNGQAKLAWLVTIYGTTTGGIRYRVFVDAKTGAVLNQYNDIHFDGPTVGSGTDVNLNNFTLQTYQIGPDYLLIDATQPMYTPPISNLQGVIVTYWNLFKGGPIVTDLNDDNIFSDNTNFRTAVSAHYYCDQTYNYYLSTFGRNSIDGLGMTIVANVHDSVYVNNAYWNGSSITFADGDGVNYRPFSGDPDVVGHELTHGVTEKTANLIYQNESGALNESMSDFFGNMIDRTTWLIGDNIRISSPGYLRNMQNPHLGPNPTRYPFGYQPAHLSEYVVTTTDNGGVHINSGIPNRAGYIVSTAITREKAEQIWYRNLTTYMTPSTSLQFWADMLCQSAEDLYGAGSPELAATTMALDSVGFGLVFVRPDNIPALPLHIGQLADSTLLVLNRRAASISVDSIKTAQNKVIVLGSTPVTIPAGMSTAFTIRADATSATLCDLGNVYDTVIVYTSAVATPVLRVPVASSIGYIAAPLDTTSMSSSCLTAGLFTDPGVRSFTKSGNNTLFAGSLLIGRAAGGDTTVYWHLYDPTNFTSVDSFVRSVSIGGDSLATVRFVTGDGRIYGKVRYQIEPTNVPGCSYLAVDYWLTNPCDPSVTITTGIQCDWDINVSSSNLVSVDVANKMIYATDAGNTIACALVQLDGTPRNLRAISNPALIYNGYTKGEAYKELVAVSNVTGGTQLDWSTLLTLGQQTLGPTDTAHYRMAFLYSSTGSAGLGPLLAEINPIGCCAGLSGNVDCDPLDLTDIADLTSLIDYLYITFAPPCCVAEANTDGAGGIDIADLSALIDYLYISFTPPAPCQ